MQPQALLTVSGHVVDTRKIEVPARTDEKSGQSYDAYSYVEVSILVPAALDNEPTPGLTAVTTVTDAVGGKLASTPKGTAVDVLVRSYSTWKRYRGRSFPVAALRFCGLVETASDTARRSAA